MVLPHIIFGMVIGMAAAMVSFVLGSNLTLMILFYSFFGALGVSGSAAFQLLRSQQRQFRKQRRVTSKFGH